MKPLRFHPSVQGDVNTAFRFYREVSEQAAERFWKGISAAFEAIRANPEQHHFDRHADEFR